jgi:hypothetical protein
MPKYKMISPFIKFSGDNFTLVAIHNSELNNLEEIESLINKEFKYEGTKLIPICEENMNMNTTWDDGEYTLFIFVGMWG